MYRETIVHTVNNCEYIAVANSCELCCVNSLRKNILGILNCEEYCVVSRSLKTRERHLGSCANRSILNLYNGTTAVDSSGRKLELIHNVRVAANALRSNLDHGTTCCYRSDVDLYRCLCWLLLWSVRLTSTKCETDHKRRYRKKVMLKVFHKVNNFVF